MKYSLLLLPLLALPAASQDDVYKTLSLGDRVQITFRSGNTISGRLIPSPLSVQAKSKDQPRISLSSGPFAVLYFRDDKDQVCETQDLILDSWFKRHSDGKLEKIQKGAKAELWQLHNIEGTPAVVLQDRGTGRAVSAVGLQNEAKLDELLTRLRGKGAADGEGPDYVRDRTLTIDLSWEYPGLNGSMTVDKKEIREIRKLQNLDEKTMAEIAKEKKKVQADLERQNADLRKAAAEREKAALEEIDRARELDAEKAKVSGAEGKLKAELEKFQRYNEILRKFPPPAWGEKRLDDIARKTQTRTPVTPEEREFMANFGLWKEAAAAQEADKKAAEELKKKEGKPEEKK